MSWLHSCKRVSELLSQSLDEPLGWFDRLRLRAHLTMCSDCSNVEQQLKAVRALSTGLYFADDDPQARLPVDQE